jgi:hypothetical protein
MRERRTERIAFFSAVTSFLGLLTVIVYTLLTWRLAQSAVEELRPSLALEGIDFHTATGVDGKETPSSDFAQFTVHLTNPGRVGVRFHLVSYTLKGAPMPADPTTFVLFPGRSTTTILWAHLDKPMPVESFEGITVHARYEYATLGDDLRRNSRFYEKDFMLTRNGDVRLVQTLAENGD